jgi:hypothetical protein
MRAVVTKIIQYENKQTAREHLARNWHANNSHTSNDEPTEDSSTVLDSPPQNIKCMPQFKQKRKKLRLRLWLPAVGDYSYSL